MPVHVTTLVYAFAAGRVAMIRRRKPPNLGLWTPPGGKVEPGESPLENGLRELAEETGLTGHDARLRVVVSEVDPIRDEAWWMFVFVAQAEGRLAGEGREGAAAWVALADMAALPQPPADPAILSAVLDPRPGVAFVTARYAAGQLADVHVRWDST